jgi:ABC-type transport system involved in cytochrome c biogenesis permease subunit
MTVAQPSEEADMKRLALAAILAAVMLVPAASATAAGPTLKSLQAQITTLKKQVKTLQKQVKANQNFSLASLAYSGCSFAVAADAFQGTWTALDARLGAPPLFGTQTPVDDFGVCQAFSIVRAKNQNPPTVGVFQALLNVFK